MIIKYEPTAVFASFPECNHERFLKRRKARRTRILHPSCPYNDFSTALSLGENTWKRSASPKGSACNSRPTGRARAQLPAPAATFWGLYMEIRWDLLTERFGLLSTALSAARRAAERLAPKDWRYRRGSSGIAALCQRQHHLRGHGRVTRGTFSKRGEQEPPPRVTGVCFEMNTHYRAAFTSEGSQCAEATKCHRPDAEKCWRTAPDWENYQQQRARNFIAIRQV